MQLECDFFTSFYLLKNIFLNVTLIPHTYVVLLSMSISEARM
jgi:hypothetical protein